MPLRGSGAGLPEAALAMISPLSYGQETDQAAVGCMAAQSSLRQGNGEEGREFRLLTGWP
jgi:hypothetical protein